MPDKISEPGKQVSFVIPKGAATVQPALSRPGLSFLYRDLMVDKKQVQSVVNTSCAIPEWMAHRAFQTLPPGPKRYLWDWKTQQDRTAGRAPLHISLRRNVLALPSRAWFIRSTHDNPYERREAFEPKNSDGFWPSWIQGDLARKVEKIAQNNQTDLASLTILRDFLNSVLGPVADHKEAQKKFRGVLPRVHPDNVRRLLRPGDKLAEPGYDEASAKCFTLLKDLSLLPTEEQKSSPKYLDRQEEWYAASRYASKLGGVDRSLEYDLRKVYNLYQAVQVILREPIYRELLFRVPEATVDAKLSLKNIGILLGFLCVMFLDRMRTALSERGIG